MKIKFTLQRPAGPVDLVATVDSATTIGELAGYVATADPTARGTATGSDVTFTVVGSESLAMNARQPVVESGLRSGAVVSIGRGGAAFADPQRTAVAVLRILDGPDAGREFPLPAGSSVIGREHGCDIRLSDALISRHHARINVSEVVEIVDLGSANGVLIDELAVPRSVLRAGDTVRIGDTTLSVRLIAAAPAAGAASVGFIRSPRLDPEYAGVRLEAPEPPERPSAQRFPLIALLAPLVMGAVLYMVTRQVASLIFVALSPLLMIGNNLEGRRNNRSSYKQAVRDFRADVESLAAELESAAGDEVAARQREHPATVECVGAVRHGTPMMWTRRPGERGFAELRLGAGRLPSRSEVELPRLKRTARALHTELLDQVKGFATVQPVPVVARLADSALGVAGPRVHALPVARALVGQLVALHSPAELVVAAVAASQSARDWDWLKWLPHTTSAHKPVNARLLATTAAAGATLVSELEELLEQRSGDPSTSVAVAMLVESDAPVERSRLVALAERGPAAGIYLIWVADDVPSLPAACRCFVEPGRDGLVGAAGFVVDGTAISPLQLEVLDADTAHELGRSLAPVVDVGARLDDASDLPRAVSLLTLNGPELAATPDAVLERWRENRSIVTGPLAPATPPRHAGSLRAVIGQSAGEVHALDLRTDGPHALVGGTTGSGKSELLQAWILAMAAAHSPQRLSFLLVDYKGGSAFRDCVDLPHTVGLVTDLSQHLVRRALTSLAAELRYRELLLARHGAKDLVALERQGVAEAPPSLVLVVDEFAALIAEVPEFVEGVVNVAQRGRSLGLHLILATQRPAGVIKDNLRANTNLRIALRMADEGDSTDVLGAPDAAFFDPGLPGRAVSKTGPGRLMPFQTGYAGGWTSDTPLPEILVEELVVGTGTLWQPPEPEQPPADPGRTDIRRLVDSIRQASEAAELPAPRKPWLPELRPAYDLADAAAVPSRRVDTELVFGVRDDPESQLQPTVAFHPDRDGNLAVYGTGGAGKSTLLRTLAVAAGFTVRGGPCHVYGVDFGARGLSMLEELPHVGSVISGSDHERITRLLGWLRNLIDDRALRYSRVNAGAITDYRRITGTVDEPRVLLLIDGIAAFRQAYESTDRLRWFDMFTSIAADGRPVGVHVVLSSDQRGGLSTALASAVQSRVVLRLANPDDYGMLGVPADVLTTASPPGRGVLAADELQVAVLGGTADVLGQAAAIRGFAEAMRRSGVSEAPPVGALPDLVDLGGLAAGPLPVIGLGATDLGPAQIEARGSFLVTGPPGSGRSTALRTVVAALLRHDPATELHYYGNKRSSLADLPVWRSRSFGDEATFAASELALRVAGGQPGAPLAVIIENVADFVGGPADSALQELARACLAEDRFLVVEGEVSTLASSYGLLGFAKSSRSGLALQPEQADGSVVFRTNFPRVDRGQSPAGRGLLVRFGRVEVVQVAVSTSPAGGE